MSKRRTSTKGFAQTGKLLQKSIRSVGETRGFAQTRLLTHWAEIVGASTAGIATPVNVSYGKGGMGATLTVLTTGAQAPMLEMQKEQIREKVNGCYGYRAIARVRITQTAPTGFHEGRASFAPAPTVPKGPTPAAKQEAADLSRSIQSDDLRAALAALGANIISKGKS